MRSFKSGLIVGFLLLVPYFQLNAQNCSSARYIDRVFDSVTVTTDVIYANAPSVTTPYVAENVTINIDLKLDVFEPTGDTLNKRPLVILAFGGGFLIGAKEDEDIRATCDSLARLGYVTASIDYRLGMNILVTTSAERAVYRAIQDYSAAVRYFKEFATTYSIDTNYIFIGGVSAGAIASLHLAFAEESDRPVSTFSSSFPNPAPDLGCRDCSGNSYNHSSTNVKAVINCWGAMGDVNWIEPGEDVPIISFHGDQDVIVPYDSGYPFTAMTTMPYVYGSLPISQHADSIGLYHEFYPFPGEGHNVWGTVVNNLFVGGPTGYFQPILHSISDFLFLFIKPNTDSITGDVMVCLNDTSTYSVNNTTGSFYCWTVNGGTIVSTDSTQNTIDVMWNTTGQNNIIVREINKFQAIGDTQSFSVMINPLPTISVANDLSICVGDTVTIFGGGASTYLWSPATALEDPAADTTKAYPTTSTTYTLTGSDSNNCKAEDSMAITVNSLPNVSVTNDLNICIGDTVVIIGSGAATYQWSPTTALEDATSGSTNAYPTTSTTYTLTGIDSNNCVAKDSLAITVNPLPVVSIQEQNDTLFADMGYSYQWYHNDTAMLGINSSYIIPQQSGSYTVVATDTNGCEAASTAYDYIYVNLPFIRANNPIKIYPNPSNGIFTIHNTTSREMDIKITDILGKTIYSRKVNEEDWGVDISTLPKGTYIIKLTTDYCNTIQKVITL